VSFDSISVAAATFSPEDGNTAGGADLLHAVPGVAGGTLRTGEYGWEPWIVPEYRERRKESYGIVRDAFGEYARTE